MLGSPKVVASALKDLTQGSMAVAVRLQMGAQDLDGCLAPECVAFLQGYDQAHAQELVDVRHGVRRLITQQSGTFLEAKGMYVTGRQRIR